MVVPDDVAAAADRGDIAVVQSWLNNAGPGAVNDRCDEGYTCLHRSMALYGATDITREHVELARWLIARGADVNLRSPGGPEYWAPLHYACCYPLGPGSAAMVSILLRAGARVNARTGSDGYCSHPNSLPLGIVLKSYIDLAGHLETSSFGEIMIALLRAGASLDRCADELSAEDIMQEFADVDPTIADDEDYIKCRKIIAGVREHGSYKRYLRAPHREFLRFRSLLVRGRAKTNGLNERIARLPNGACWKVLSYWRDPEREAE